LEAEVDLHLRAGQLDRGVGTIVMRRAKLFMYAGAALLLAAAPLTLAQHLVPAFKWLSMVCLLAGSFSLMAAREGPSKAAVGFGQRLLAFAGIWVLICVGLIVYWMR
jgi:hypothetical protein